MSVSLSRWQRVLGVVVTLIMMFALVAPTAADAHKAPVTQAPPRIQAKVFQPTFVGQTNGTAAQIAERLYGPSRGVTTTATSNNGPYKELKTNLKIPHPKKVGIRPAPGGEEDEGDGRLLDEPSPDVWASWNGLGQSTNRTLFNFGVYPPDTNGDSSGDVYSTGYYVQTVNLTMAVWDYSQVAMGGRGFKVILGPMPINELWSGTGTACEGTNDGDPVVLYDEQADRWLITQFALPLFDFNTNPFPYDFYECIAVSQTGDPSGAYYLYEVPAPITGIDDDYDPGTAQVPGQKMPDYPKFGIWQDSYVMTVNQFEFYSDPNGAWGGAGVYAFDRTSMLGGSLGSFFYWDPFSQFNCSMGTYYTTESNQYCFLGGMLPADNDGGWANWGTGNDAYLAMFEDDAWSTASYITGDQLDIFNLNLDFGTPSASMGLEATLPTDAFDSAICGYDRNCIPQPGTTVKLDAISDRLMHRLQFRHIERPTGETYEAMVTNQTVNVGSNQAGIRWYQLRRDWTGSSWTDWYIAQQGTYAPDTANRWMGSAAMDAVGNIGLGYSVSSASIYPTIRYTTHAVTDPAGTMRDENTITPASIAAGSQTGPAHRWGDYSMMSVSSDGCDFVYTNEYLRGTSPVEWYTFVGNFGFMSCFYDDVEGPVLEWLSTPSDPSPYRYGSFDWDVLTEATGLDYYECSLDGEPWFVCSPTYNFSLLSSGYHTFEVRGVDTLGNVGNPISYTWEITASTANFVSVATYDGNLIESGEFTNVGGLGSTAAGGYIQVGDQTRDRQSKGLMSFNVSLPLGAVITDARIQYVAGSFIGTNPFTTHGPLTVDLAAPYFGAGLSLAASDFQASPSFSDVASCDTTPFSGFNYRCWINGAYWGSLNGTVQFRFAFTLDDNDDGGADLLQMASGNSTVSRRPVLVIDYYIP